MSIKKELTIYITKWKKDGGKTTFYKCAFCEKEIETIKPQKHMVDKKGYWDSVKICPECSRLSFVKVYPSGKTIVIKLN